MLEMVSCEMGGGTRRTWRKLQRTPTSTPGQPRHQHHANLVPPPPPSCKNESKAHQAPRFPASQTTNPPEQTTICRYATKRTWESLHPKPPIHQKQTMLACRACNITSHPPPTKCIVGELPLRDVYLSRERYVAPQRHVAARASDLARENGRMTAPGTRTSRASPRCLGVLNTTVP